jgi:uncharacterized protein YdaU (DUF1376 family)
VSKAPHFPFFVRDWLCSRKVLKMNGEAVKAYTYLLCEAWLQEPRATLPNNDEELASMARTTLSAWMIIKSDVMLCFKIGTCEEHLGRLYNELQLEISRKFEKNQRVNNKNAKRTRIKRDINAKSPLSVSLSISESEVTNTKNQEPPSAGLLEQKPKKKTTAIKFILGSIPITFSAYETVVNWCDGDRDLADHAFYRSRRSDNPLGWIRKGLTEKDKNGNYYARLPTNEETVNPQSVREWIDKVVNHYAD